MTSQVSRVLVVDDHPVFRSGLCALLDLLPTVDVVGEARSRAEAVGEARRLRPDIVLMDVNLAESSGVEATRMIVAEQPGVAVLALTMLDEKPAILAMVRAGARGYLLKGAGADEISRAVEAVLTGQTVFSPHVAELLVDQLTGRNGVPERPFPDLTERERAVLEMVADGRDNAAIARQLHLSVKTVRNYLSRIFTKLQVAHRAEAAVRARREGIGS